MRVLGFGWVLVSSLFGFIVGACGSTEPTDLARPVPRLWKSGARLEARIEHLGTASRFAGWFDKTRAEPCQFARIDGALRCTPPLADAFFRDAACTTPVVVQYADVCSRGPDLGPAVTIVESQTCGGAADLSVRPVGAPIATAMIYAKHEDRCERLDASPFVVHALGDPIDPSTFARGENVDVAIESNLVLRRIVTEDGAELNVDVRDPAKDASCLTGYPILYDGPYRDRCVPGGGLVEYTDDPYLFSDASCTEGARGAWWPASTDACDGPPPLQSTEFARPADRCAFPVLATIRRIGAAREAVTYQRDPMGCAETHFDTPHRFLPFEDVLPPESFPLLPRRALGTPYGVESFVSSAGDAVLSLGRFDGCFVVELEGDRRCVPRAATFESKYGSYADAACTQLLFEPFSECDVTPFVVEVDNTCGYRTVAVYERGAALSADAQIYRRTDVGAPCEGPVSRPPDREMYRLGRKLAPEELPTIDVKPAET